MSVQYPAVYNSGTSEWTSISPLEIPSGGSENQVLAKNSNTDYDVNWVSQSQPYRNLILNGAMQVAQRGTSATNITSGGYYTVDRWDLVAGGFGTWTQTIENDGPSGSGFRKSLKMLCTTAQTSPINTNALSIIQKLEGQNLQAIKKGTANAEQLTVSFWVKSNVTGTFVVRLGDTDNGRFCSRQYTISASETWEKKILAFPADTVGLLNNDNDMSFFIDMWLGAGSSYTTGPELASWNNTSSNLTSLAPNQTNLAASTNNYWQITGVQLEVGPTATPFEFKPYGQELQECRRYYYLHSSGVDSPVMNAAAITANYIVGIISFPVAMRTNPTLVSANGTNFFFFNSAAGGGSNAGLTTFYMTQRTTNAATVYGTLTSNSVAGYAGWVRGTTSSSSISFYAEL